jgi:hypothetical protein
MKIFNKHKGLSIVEVLVSFLILTIVVGAAVAVQRNVFTINKVTKDRTFAGQKAMQMMEELKSLSEGGETSTDTLELRGNGENEYSAVLTTEKLKDSENTFIDSNKNSKLPSSATSENYLQNGAWRFVRNIQVARLPGDPRSRKVTVKVYLADQDLNPIGSPLAQLSSVLKTIANPNPPSQFIDTYALAISNIPGWWASMPEMKSMYDNIVYDLRDKNLGLDFRTHYITVNSYGRDLLYSPYINNDITTDVDTNSTYAYFYPGKIKNTKVSPNTEESYYSLDDIASEKASGRILTFRDSQYQTLNDYDFTGNIVDNSSYAVADQFNNAMRYPEELAMFKRLNRISEDSQKGSLEPTYRLLLEDMVTTNKYKNAIFTNLHGELFPFIPLRNYSDPAKDMSLDASNNMRNSSIRVVTHPERISYSNSYLTGHPTTQYRNKINLRVYPYKRPQVGENALNSSYLSDPITLFIPFTNTISTVTSPISQLNMPNVTGTFSITDIEKYLEINYIEGNPNLSSVSNSRRNYNIFKRNGTGLNVDSGIADVQLNPSFDYDCNGTSEQVNGLLITLKGRPLRVSNSDLTYADTGTALTTGLPRRIPTISSPSGDGATPEINKGLATNRRLYGLDYIPTPLVNSGNAANDYTGFDPFYLSNQASPPNAIRGLNVNSNIVKNTARFIVSIDVTSASDNPFAQFMNKMMTVETRIGNDLNTGYRMDGSIPTKTGVVSQPNSISLTDNEVKSRISNLSRTFTWVGDQSFITSSGRTMALPITEEYQIMGDPRHNPYKDTLDSKKHNVAFTGSGVGGLASIDTSASGYDTFTNANRTITGPLFGGNNISFDVPRIFQLFRNGLLNSNSTYTSLIGYSNYYLGLGGELGGDTSNPQYFTMNGSPFNSSSYVSIREDLNSGLGNEITTGSTYVIDSGKTWFSIPTLGELYPDDAFHSQWINRGNLSSLGSLKFYRTKLSNSDFDIGGTDSAFINRTINKRLQGTGCSSFFNGGFTSGQYFNHSSGGDIAAILTRTSGSLIGMGDDMNSSLGTYFEDTVANRPFILDSTNTPPQRSNSNINSIYNSLNTKISFLNDTNTIDNQRVIYRNSSSSSVISGITKLFQDSGKVATTPNNRAYVVVNGLKPVGDSGKITVAKLAITSMLYTFLNTADIAKVGNTDNFSVPIPYIGLTSNNLPETDVLSGLNTPSEGFEITNSSIPFEFIITWKKWDRSRYTSNYLNDWEPRADRVRLRYQVIYSDDSQKTWKYPNGMSAKAGIFDPNNEITPNSISNKTGDTALGIKRFSYNYNISSLEKGKNYTFRLEVYRDNYNFVTNDFETMQQHYSYHQREYYLK